MTNIIERTERDKYGRTVRHLSVENFRTLVVIVTLPKGFAEMHPEKGRYLVNDWQHEPWIDGVSQGEAEGKLTYAHSLKAARAIAASKIA